MLQTPAYEASKLAYRADQQTPCGADAALCQLAVGESFWWLVKARVTAGAYSKFEISDTLVSGLFNTDTTQNVATCSGTAGKVTTQSE